MPSPSSQDFQFSNPELGNARADVGSNPFDQASFLGWDARADRVLGLRAWRGADLQEVSNLVFSGLDLIFTESQRSLRNDSSPNLRSLLSLCESLADSFVRGKISRHNHVLEAFCFAAEEYSLACKHSSEEPTVQGFFEYGPVLPSAKSFAMSRIELEDSGACREAERFLLRAKQGATTARFVQLLRMPSDEPPTVKAADTIRSMISSPISEAIVNEYSRLVFKVLRDGSDGTEAGYKRATYGTRDWARTASLLCSAMRELVSRESPAVAELLDSCIDKKGRVPAAVAAGLVGSKLSLRMHPITRTDQLGSNKTERVFLGYASPSLMYVVDNALPALSGQLGENNYLFARHVIFNGAVLNLLRSLPVNQVSSFLAFEPSSSGASSSCRLDSDSRYRCFDALAPSFETRTRLLNAHIANMLAAGNSGSSLVEKNISPAFLRWVLDCGGERDGTFSYALGQAIFSVAAAHGPAGLDLLCSACDELGISKSFSRALASISLCAAGSFGESGSSLLTLATTPRIEAALKSTEYSVETFRSFILLLEREAPQLAEDLTDAHAELFVPILLESPLSTGDLQRALGLGIWAVSSGELPASAYPILASSLLSEDARSVLSNARDRGFSRRHLRALLALGIQAQHWEEVIPELASIEEVYPKFNLLLEQSSEFIQRYLGESHLHAASVLRVLHSLASKSEDPEQELRNFSRVLFSSFDIEGEASRPAPALRDPMAEYSLYRKFCQAFGIYDMPVLFRIFRTAELEGASGSGRFAAQSILEQELELLLSPQFRLTNRALEREAICFMTRVKPFDQVRQNEVLSRVHELFRDSRQSNVDTLQLAEVGVISLQQRRGASHELSDAERLKARELKRLFLGVYEALGSRALLEPTKYPDARTLEIVLSNLGLTETQEKTVQQSHFASHSARALWGRRWSTGSERFASSNWSSLLDNEFLRAEKLVLERSITRVGTQSELEAVASFWRSVRTARAPGELLQGLVIHSTPDDLRGRYSESLLRLLFGSIFLSRQAQDVVRDVVESEGDLEWHCNLASFFDVVVDQFALREIFGRGRDEYIARTREALEQWRPVTIAALPQNPNTSPLIDLQLTATRGVWGELSGFISQTCWGRDRASLFDGSPELFFLGFRRRMPNGVQRFPGGTMVAVGESLTSGKPVVVLRGFNPTLDLLRQVSTEEIFERTIDALLPFAQQIGAEAFAVPFEERCGNTHTNRPDVHLYLRDRYFNGSRQTLKLRDSNSLRFNGADISGRCIAVRKL